MHFNTSQLTIDEVTQNIDQKQKHTILSQVPIILTNNVVKELPSTFHGITTTAQADKWFNHMVSTSKLSTISLTDKNELIGFLFIYVSENAEAHLGYLIKEAYWGQGLAKEFLSHFVEWVKNNTSWSKLIGGVSKSNIASSQLLKRVGFTLQGAHESNTEFYEYVFK